MSEAGRQAVDEEADSPWPAGYGRLDSGAPEAAAEPPPAAAPPHVAPPSAAPPTAPPPSGPPLDGPLPGRSQPDPVGAAEGRRVRTAPPPPRPAAPDRPVPLGRPTLADRDSDTVVGPVRGRLRPHRDVRVVRGVRSRRLVRRVDVWTVFKVSVVFYLLLLVVLVVAGVVVWQIAQAFGYITSIDKSIRTLFSLKTFALHPTSTLEYGAGVGAVLCLFGALLNTLVAAVYNLISDVVGGVQVVVVSEVE